MALLSRDKLDGVARLGDNEVWNEDIPFLLVVSTTVVGVGQALLNHP